MAGISILAIFYVIWRSAYEWIIGLSVFRERVYVLGSGEQARTLVETLRARRDAGMEVVEGTVDGDCGSQAERFAADLRAFSKPNAGIDRVIVAMEERRGSMPVRELLDLRLKGVVIEDSSSLLERLSGRLPLEGLNPSTLIFTNGFNRSASHQIVRRLISITVSFIGLAICLPFIPFIILAVRLSSPGPIFFRQTRVGLHGHPFVCAQIPDDAAGRRKNGAVWATKNDARVTPLGKFMRTTRLDEIPQLWNVLRGDMGFVGPRPERPEFVQWLTNEIPFYDAATYHPPGNHRMGTGAISIRRKPGGDQAETRIRSLLHQARVDRT